MAIDPPQLPQQILGGTPRQNDSVAAPQGLLGIRNKLRPERQPYGAMEEAVNVDVDDSLTVERRDGYSPAVSLTSATSAYSMRDQSRGFIFDDSTLYSIDPSLALSTLKTGLTPGKLYWAESDSLVFYTGDNYGQISRHGWMPLSVPSPPTPSVQAIGGVLPAGQYQVCSTLTHDDSGLEGAASPPFSIDLQDNQSLRITISPMNGYTNSIYVTSTNGAVFYRIGSIPFGDVIFNGPLTGLAFELDPAQKDTSPLPEGCTVCEAHEMRLYAAQYQSNDTTVLWFSKPGWYNLFDLSTDFEIYPGKITGLASTEKGLLVVTSQEVSVLSDRTRTRLTWYGAPEGYPIAKTPDGRAFAWTDRGLITYPEFKNLTETNVDMPAGYGCVVSFMQRHGREKLVVCTDTAGAANNQY